MKFKIKTQPADFKVVEVSSLPITKNGLYSVYLLEKTGWNTTDALFEIASQKRIAFKNFSYGGKKDRHAVTSQFVTFKGRRIDDVIEKNYSLRFQGFAVRAMGPQFITANRFEITVRKLTAAAAEAAEEKRREVVRFGFVNYFDDQRFGSYDALQGFIVEKMLKDHLNGALKTYMTAIHPEDKGPEKERKKYLYDHWKDWPACLAKARTTFERDVFEHLVSHPKDFAFLIRQIPAERMAMAISAYQSFLWNEIVRRFLQVKMNAKWLTFPGRVGDYFFYPVLSSDLLRVLKDLVIPLPAGDAKMPDPSLREIYDQVLADHGLAPTMFNKLISQEFHFKPTPRPIIAFPRRLVTETLNDDIYGSAKKLILHFELPRGSYATIFVKRLFSSHQDENKEGRILHADTGEEI